MVEVFKTNVHRKNDAIRLLAVLLEEFPWYKINFDLEDCDKILRVEGERLSSEKIIRILNATGHECHVID
jgi:hypothetical protein